MGQTCITDDQRWQAVLRRDREANSEFVYAVSSTGIYCRPSCPARRPGRARVRFFAAPGAAEAAGYRPCRRCSPAGVDTDQEAVDTVCRLIDEAIAPPTLAWLSGRVGMSPERLRRLFTRTTGVTPRQYASARRLESAKAALRSAGTVTEAIYQAGYGSSRSFYEGAGGRLGMAPACYRGGAVSTRIAYSVGDSPLGRLLVAVTARGVCAVCFGDADADLLRGLADEFPGATVVPDDAGLATVLREVVERLEGRAPSAALPLDVRATAFRWRVWRALQEIPFGETRTYGQVAASVGSPGGARAVGAACAANPVAVLVPCHRVTRADGAVGGYRWGPGRKRLLVDLEADASARLAEPGRRATG